MFGSGGFASRALTVGGSISVVTRRTRNLVGAPVEVTPRQLSGAPNGHLLWSRLSSCIEVSTPTPGLWWVIQPTMGLGNSPVG